MPAWRKGFLMLDLRALHPLKRFIRFITFIDLPIKKKFTLYSVGVLFWFLAMAVVTFIALFSINLHYNRVIKEAIPQDRVVQKIIRNLQALSIDASAALKAHDVESAVRAADLSHKRLQDIRSFAAALALGGEVNDYSHDTGKLLETVRTSSVRNDPAGVQFLKDLNTRLGQIDDTSQDFFAARLALLKTGSGVPEALAKSHDQLQKELYAANNLAVDFSAQLSDLFNSYARTIGRTIRETSLAIAGVLGIAVLLLGLFTFWIAGAIAKPIRSIIDQIQNLGTGDVDLTNKIKITSRDEIGQLSSEFNELMETVYGMTMFKKVIEEDATLDDVYSRLGAAFREECDIDDFVIYEVKDNHREMHPVYPALLGPKEMACSPDILANCELCRARKTGHTISSLSYPGICKQFKPETGLEHVCIPMIIGGRTGGVVQFLFAPDDAGCIDAHEIHSRIFKAETYINQSLSVIEAKRLMNTLRDSALKDPMTGLYNRRFLQDHAGPIIAGLQRRKKTLGLVMCDLDYFKQVNDKYGHDVGDQILKETAGIIRKSVREADIVIRFGGEEFLVLVVDINPGEAHAVAEKIRANMQAAKFSTSEGPLKKTISLGVAEFPGDSEAFWQTIKYADVALYKAKEEGRNRALRFKPEMWKGEEF